MMTRLQALRFAFLGFAALMLAPYAALAAPPDAAVQHALAPSGALKVGVYRGSPSSIIEGKTPEENRGVGYDLGKALAAALGVKFEPVIYPANAPLLKAVHAGEVDIVFTNATKARARTMDFSQPFMGVEKSFLVPAGSKLKTQDDATQKGLRIGVSKGSSTARELTEQFPQMTLTEVDTLKHAGEMLAAHEIDAFATNNAILYELSDHVPGSAVLPGHWGMEHFGAGIPQGRQAGMPFLRDFMAKAMADGTVDRAIKRANLRGTVPETIKN
ncbi:MAG: transporter substrate-binding domain-containing protein [Proteobacteria bacterium]|nr:transporter substrate-binding domain-containing protein [Pseudomonadota bacterium]